MAKKEETSIVKKEEAPAGSIALLSERPSWLAGEDRRGNENVGAADIMIPRLEVVQALSGARKKQDPGYIEGAQEGDLYNSLTRELYGPTVPIIPIYFRVEYLVWIDRKDGGGFRGSYPTPEEARAAALHIQQEDKKKAEVIDTPQQFVLILKPDGSVEEVVLSMPKSKQKTSRKLNSLIRMAGGPRFGRVYELSSVAEKNSNNDDYYNFAVAVLGYPPELIYRRAEKAYEMINSSSVAVSTAGYDDVGSGDAEM